MAFWRRLLANPSAVVGLVVILLYVLAAVFAPQIAPYGPREMVLTDRLMPPAFVEGGSRAHLLGTDQLGQDIFSRILYGARVSLLVGLISVAISLAVGTVLGCIAG